MARNPDSIHVLSPHTHGKSLLSLLTQNGLAPETDCGGQGICGKCKVKFIEGAASTYHPDELELLTKEEREAGIRLACLCHVDGEVTVSTAQSSTAMQIQEQSKTHDYPLDPVIKKKYFTLSPGDNESLYHCLLSKNGTSTDHPLAVARALGRSSPNITVITCKGKIIGFEEGDTRSYCYGIAVDIGTTTVVAQLVDLNSGRTLSTASAINPQFSLGSDVLSRIHYAGQDPAHIQELSALIGQAVTELASSLFTSSGVSPDLCYIISVAANTAMMHLFLGIDPHSLGRYPYRPVFLEALQFKASDLKIPGSPFAILHCLPGLSGFVGADITAGLMALNLTEAEKNVLFIDMGTNGEIVLCFNGRLIATSTAAGPALEGMNISCGMKASTGAIDHVSLSKEGKITWTTIGSAPPVGLCGSGLLDTVATLLKCGVIQRSGRLVEPGKSAGDGIREMENSRCFQLVPPSGNSQGVYLSQQDIRQVQLAKGALASGIKLLLQQVGLSESEIDTVYLAGGFGYYLRSETLITLGLFPPLWKDRIVYVGNTALAGARLAILCSGLMERNQERLKEVEFFDLTSCHDFNRIFARSMVFH